MRLSRPLAAALGVLSLTAVACGGSSSDSSESAAETTKAPATTAAATGTTTAASGGTLTIGAIEMLSGSGAFYGKAVQEGLEIAVDELNKKGGILGNKVVLKVEDNASDNAQTTTLVKKYAQDSKVGAIIPPTYQPNFNAACSAATEAGLPIVSAQSGPADAKNNTKNFCFTMTTDPIPQVTYTLKALQAKGIKTLAMVYDQDNGYVKFQKPNIEQAAKDLGITITEIGVPGGTTDFGPQITQLIGGKPDATFPFFTIEDAARFMKQAKDKGYTAKWFDPVSQLTSRRIPELSGGAAVGLLASTPQSAGDIKSFQAFLDAYKQKNGKALDDPTYTGFGYDAMMELADAMTRANSTSDRAKIQSAIMANKKPCFSICFTLADSGPNNGAFLADQFFMVTLTADGFAPAK